MCVIIQQKEMVEMPTTDLRDCPFYGLLQLLNSDVMQP